LTDGKDSVILKLDIKKPIIFLAQLESASLIIFPPKSIKRAQENPFRSRGKYEEPDESSGKSQK